jgi:agmatinase
MTTAFGVPLDCNGSYLRGPARAPAHIREVLNSGVGEWFAENGRDVRPPSWHDAGDLALDNSPAGVEASFDMITAAARDAAQAGRVLAWGGDHSITYPLVRGVADVHGPLTILHFDAHADLYDTFDGNRFSHACPFTRICESGLTRRLIQVGIRAFVGEHLDQAKRFGIETIMMKDWAPNLSFTLDGPVYLSLDIDVLDPAFAPGISHHEPGGASVRDVLRVIQSLRANLVAADIVEFNPARDVNGMTAAVAAKFTKELLAKLTA